MLDGNSSVVGLFTDHTVAERAVKALQLSGVDMKKLSVVGRDDRTEETVGGYYNTGDRMAAWGTQGLFWGWIWGLLCGSAFLLAISAGRANKQP